MRHTILQSLDDTGDASSALPQRPGAPDCLHYARTGRCDYGISCCFDHPPRKMLDEAFERRDDYPKRVGQPDCQFYLRTGTCKFGSTCRYHHPRENAGILGKGFRATGAEYPLRLGEFDCAYYLKTGTCKFGMQCKFNHPPPAYLHTAAGIGLRAEEQWKWPHKSCYAPLPVPREGFISMPEWTAYRNHNGPLVPTSTYNMKEGTSAAASYSVLQDPNFPERPGQPECMYYRRTGYCKFGASCPFNHPKISILSLPECGSSSQGLPEWPGHVTTNQAADDDDKCIQQPEELHDSLKALISKCEQRSVELNPNKMELQPASQQLSLILNLTYQGQVRRIVVGVVLHSIPQESLEFFFFSGEDMVVCVGVGFDQSRVLLTSDLGIEIIEADANEWALQQARWKAISSDKSCQLVMDDDVHGQSLIEDEQVQSLGLQEAQVLCRQHGIGFEYGTSHYVDETLDQTEASWPLLYDMAQFIIANASAKQCNNQSNSASSNGSGERQKQKHSMRHKLHNHKGKSLNSGGGSGDGDADEDGNNNACKHDLLKSDDDPPIVLRVIVHPLSKDEILDTRDLPLESCHGLESASIAPRLVFEFRRNRQSRRISITALTRMELGSTSEVLDNENLFGWYHTGIQILLGCEDIGRAAILNQNSCKMLNPITTSKYTAVKSSTLSTTDTCSGGGQIAASLSTLGVAGVEVQGVLSSSRMKAAGTIRGRNVEMDRDCVCKGFSFRDCSTTECPARADFTLFYPLRNVSLWDSKELLLGQGLFSSIEPEITGTWIAVNHSDTSPYMFKVKRVMRLHTRRGAEEVKDHVTECKQQYLLSFFVNHAMTHLKRQKAVDIQLNGEHLSLPNVLRVARVF